VTTGGVKTNYAQVVTADQKDTDSTPNNNAGPTPSEDDEAAVSVTPPGTIELKKQWSGTGGQTTLNIGTSTGGSQTASQQTGAAGAAPLTTGAKTVNTGTFFVSEAGGLTDYSSTLACTDNNNPVTPGTNNSVPVTTGHTV